MMTIEEKAWCALSRGSGIGPRSLWKIAEYLTRENQSAAWLLQHPEALAIALEGRLPTGTATALTIREPENQDYGDGNEVSVIHPMHIDFPARVKIFKAAFSLPALLYTRGNTSLFRKPGVAIVGARHAGDSALITAEQLASVLGARGINVISGYAKGIDTAAHCGALGGGGTTSIVLSEGINHFRIKRELRKVFTKDNALAISQFEPDAKWAAYFAMARNKLVCALSTAVVVIVSGPERDAGGKRSGTFDAGVTALKMGIPVFVAAPRFFDEAPEGNRQLIAKGGREWNPSDGAEPIIATLQSLSSLDATASANTIAQATNRQLDLFTDYRATLPLSRGESGRA